MPVLSLVGRLRRRPAVVRPGRPSRRSTSRPCRRCVGYAGRRLAAGGRAGAAYLVVPARLGGAGGAARRHARTAGSRGRGWRSARPTARSAHVARWLGGAPAVTFAVAARRRAAAAPRSALGGRAGRCGPRRGWPPSPGRRRSSAARRRWPSPLPTDGRPVHGRRSSRATCRGRAGVQRPAPGRARQPRRRRPSSSPPRSPPDEPQPDLVVWPENSSDIDPFRNADAAAADRQRASTPSACRSLVGAVLERAAGLQLQRRRCSTCPGRRRARSATSSCTRCRSPSTSRPRLLPASSATRSTSSGRLRRRPRDRRLPRAGRRRRLRRAADDLLRGRLRRPDPRQRASRRRRPSLLVVQTNNATFGYTDESEQQLAISRLRAIEHGRSVVHVSTVGVSGVRRARTARSPRRPRCSRPTSGWPRPVRAHRAHPGRPARRGARVGRRRRAASCSSSASTRAARSVRASTPATADASHPRTPTPLTETARPPLRPRRRAHPDVQRAGEPARHRRAGCATAVPEVDVLVLDDNSPDGTGAVADELAAADPQVHVLHRAGQGGPGRRLPRRLRAGPSSAATTPWSRWTPTARTSPSSCPRCSPRSSTRTSSSAPAGCPAARSSTGRCTARRSRVGGNLYTRVLLGMPVHDATGGYRVFRSDALRAMDLDDVAVAGLLLPGRPDLAGRPGRADRRRGADHVRRARGRRLQDEPRHRARGAAPDHRLGRAPPGPPGRASWSAAPASRGGTRCEPHRRHPVRRRRRRPRVLRWVFLALLIVPVVEIAAIIAVGQVDRRLADPAAARRWSRCSAPGSSSARARAPGPPCRRRCAPGGCRPPARRRRAGAGRRHAAAHARASSPTSSGFFFILPLTRPLARVWLESVVARRLLGPMGEWPMRTGHGPGAGPGRHPGRSRRAQRRRRPDVIQGEVVDRDP